MTLGTDYSIRTSHPLNILTIHESRDVKISVIPRSIKNTNRKKTKTWTYKYPARNAEAHINNATYFFFFFFFFLIFVFCFFTFRLKIFYAFGSVYMILVSRNNVAHTAFWTEIHTHLPITRMRNRNQYRKSIRGVFGFAVEESKYAYLL